MKALTGKQPEGTNDTEWKDSETRTMLTIRMCLVDDMMYHVMNEESLNCDAPTRHPVLGKGVINLRTINLLTYIILNNYLEKINLQKYFIYIHRSCIYSVMYIYFESHLLVLLGSHCLQNLIFTLTKSIQTYL